MRDEEGLEPTPFERRARAPMHFWGRAHDARRAAQLLWLATLEEPQLTDPYRREAALALELIIKAVIAQRIENGTQRARHARPALHHKLPELWKDACLPDLPRADHARLINAKYVLLWSGRYPVPREEAAYRTEDQEKQPYRQVVGKLGQRELFQEWSFCWDDFDRIFEIAADSFRTIAPYIDDDGFLVFPEGRETYKG